MWTRWVGPAVLLLAVGGCAGDGDGDEASDSGAERQAVGQLTAQLAGLDDPNGIRFTEDEARCAAEAVVEVLGADRVVGLDPDPGEEGATGLTAAALDADEQGPVYDAMTGCIDIENQTTDLFVGTGMPEETAACVAERYLATDLPQRGMMGDYDPELNAEIDAVLGEAFDACGAT